MRLQPVFDVFPPPNVEANVEMKHCYPTDSFRKQMWDMRKASLKRRFWKDATTGCRLDLRVLDLIYIYIYKRKKETSRDDMLHYLHLANTCFWWKDLPTIMGRTAEVVIIFPLSSMMFFWHSSVTRRVPVVPVELPSLYMPMAHSNLHRFHVQSWNTFSTTTGFSETTQAILIISPYSRKVYNLKFYDGSSMHSLPRYADVLMAQELF